MSVWVCVHCKYYARLKAFPRFFFHSGKMRTLHETKQKKTRIYTTMVAYCLDNITLRNGSLTFRKRTPATIHYHHYYHYPAKLEKMINKTKKKKKKEYHCKWRGYATQAQQSLSHLSLISSHFLFIPYVSQSELFYFK